MQERIISYTTVLITLEENKSCVMMMVKRLQPESVPGSFTYKLHVKNKSQVNLAVLLKKKKKYTRTWQHTKKQDKIWSFKKAVKLYQTKRR